MNFAFNNLYQQLHAFPNNGVGSETIKFVNEILGDFIKNHKEGYFVDYENLQDFITNLLKDYTLLAFKNSDFSALRKKLLLDYPNDKLYF